MPKGNAVARMMTVVMMMKHSKVEESRRRTEE